MKCEACGTTSALEAAFFKERKSFRKTIRTLCHPCHIRRRNRVDGTVQLFAFAAGALGYLIRWHNPYSTVGRILLNYFLFDVFLIFSIVPHELGHAIAARLLGWRVYRIDFGLGKTIFRKEILGTLVNFNQIPVCGLTYLRPKDTRGFKPKFFVSVLAGPAMNILMAAVAVWLAPDHDFHLLSPVWRLFALANVFVLLANLWPAKLASVQTSSDGKLLLGVFFFKEARIAAYVAAAYATESLQHYEIRKDLGHARDLCDKGLSLFPESVPLLNLTGVFHLNSREFKKAREIFVHLLAKSEVTSPIRYVLMNNIAYADALLGGSAYLVEADDYSRQAFEALSWQASFAGTRGTVLVARGQFDEGVQLLKSTIEKHTEPNNKAENACHIAIAYARQGMPQEAEDIYNLPCKWI